MTKFKLTTELKNFQKETFNIMKYNEEKYDGGMLYSSAGTGKSIGVLSIIVNDPVKTLIICPAGVIDNWMNEFKKHTNIQNSLIVKYHGFKRKENCNEIDNDKLIYITSYNLIANEFNLQLPLTQIKFGRIILDEAHYIRNSRSKLFRGVISISDLNMNSKKWVITATPIFNSVTDSYAYFRFLNLEGFDTKREWNTRIVKSGAEGYKLLNEYIKKYSILYKKENVLKDLPPKIIKNILIEFNETDQEFYDALRNYSLIRMKSLVYKIKQVKDSKQINKLFHTNILTHILRLRQACDSPIIVLNSMKRLGNCNSIKESTSLLVFFNNSKSLSEDCPICMDSIADYIANCGHKACKKCWDHIKRINIKECHICRNIIETIEKIETKNKVKKTIENSENYISTKIQCIISIIKNVIEKNEKIVISSQWLSMLSLITESFSNDNTLKKVKYIILSGQKTLDQRTRDIHDFQNNNKIKICLLSLSASSEGINLTEANHFVQVDSWWNNSKMSQATDRTHRIGQTKQVYIYNLEIKNTIENKMKKIVNKKEKISKTILNKWTTLSVEENETLTETIKLL